MYYIFVLIPVLYETEQNNFLAWQGFQPYDFYVALYKIGIKNSGFLLYDFAAKLQRDPLPQLVLQ